MHHHTCTIRGTAISLILQHPAEISRAESYETKEPETLNWIDQTMRPGDVLFDVGANIGLYSLYAALRFKGQISCFAFEPEPANWKRLNDNIIVNDLSASLIAYGIAVSAAPGLDRFYLNPESFTVSEESGAQAGTAMHRLHSPCDFSGKQFSQGHVCGVACVSVDSLWQEYGLPVPTHIKIDVDGLESYVVEGMRHTLMRRELRHILLELSPSSDSALIEMLRGAGFIPDPRFVGHSVNTMYNVIFSRKDALGAAPPRDEEKGESRPLVAPLTVCGAPTAGKAVLYALLEGHKNICSLPIWHDSISPALCRYPQLYEQYFPDTKSDMTMKGNNRRLEALRLLLTNHTEWNMLESIALQGFYVFHLSGSQRLRLPVTLDFYALEKQVGAAVWQDDSPTPPALFHILFSALHEQLGLTPVQDLKYAVSIARNEFSEYRQLLTTYPEGKILYVDRDIVEALAVTVHRKACIEGNTFSAELEALCAGNNEFLTNLVKRTEYVDHLAAIYPERVLRVDFTDLILNTEATMRRICRWLEVDFHPALLKGTFMGRVIDDRITGTVLDNMRDILSRDEWAKLEAYVAHFRKIYALADTKNAEEINLLAFLFSTRHPANTDHNLVIALNAVDDNIFYGPYMSIPPGEWKATFLFSGDSRQCPENIFLRLDCVDNTDRKYFEKKYSLQDILNSPSFIFTVDKPDCTFEFRAYGKKSGSDTEIIFHGVKLQKITPQDRSESKKNESENTMRHKSLSQKLLGLFSQ